MTVGLTKRVKAIPPDRGSFPLDHKGVCREITEKYVACTSSLRGNAFHCRHLAAEYLKCRIDNGLMVSEPLENFGFRACDLDPEAAKAFQTAAEPVELVPRKDRKEAKGFVAGVGVVETQGRHDTLITKVLSKLLKD